MQFRLFFISYWVPYNNHILITVCRKAGIIMSDNTAVPQTSWILCNIILKPWKKTNKVTGLVYEEGEDYVITNSVKKKIDCFGYEVTSSVAKKGDSFSSNDDSHNVWQWCGPDFKKDYQSFVNAHCNGNFDEPQIYFNVHTDEFITVDDYSSKYSSDSYTDSTQPTVEQPSM